MVYNLTGAIAANVTLIQPGYNGFVALILAAIFGAFVSGGLTLARDHYKDKRNRRDSLVQAYSKLTGQKFLLSQVFTNMLFITVDFYYNAGMIHYMESRAESCAGSQEAESCLKQAEESKLINLSTNGERFDEVLEYLTESQQGLWENIGIIRGLIDNDELKEIIKNIEISIESIEKFRKAMIAETKETLPKVEINKNNITTSKWGEEKKAEISKPINDLELKIQDLLNYIDKEIAKSRRHFWTSFINQ
jgi:hypothetical protein